MKGVKNFIILLGFALAFALATPKASALSISDVWGFCNEWNANYTYKIQYSYDTYNFIVRNSFNPRADVSISFKSWLEPYRTFYNVCSSASKSFMGYYRKQDWYLDLRTYDINYNLLESDIALSGVLWDFSWYYVPLTNIWLANNNYILYNDDLSHTLQYLWNYKIRDYIVWVDPLTSTLNDDTIDNFYLISIPKRKAWSLKVDSTTLQDFFYWNIANYDFRSLNYTNSYSLTQTTNTTIFPKNSVYMNNTRSYFDNDIWFNYIKDGSFIAPDFWDNIETDTDTNYFNVQLVNYYNSCVNKWENLRKALQLSAYCKLQWESAWENIIINTWLNYTWSYSYCSELDQFIVNAYWLYSWNWNNWIINENTDLQDNSAPFNDLIFSWYYNSLFIDSNHNLSWLPNWNSRCSAFTVSQFYNNEKSTIEKISDSITDFFGSGVAWIYNDTVWSHSTFSWLITSLSAWTSWFFNSYLFDPYIEQFNSWYNKFYSAVNLSWCSVIKQTFPDTIYWDIVFYVAIIWLILLFLKLL